MKFSCDQCGAQYMIADEKVGTRGVKVKCKKCTHVIIVKPPATQPDAPVHATPPENDEQDTDFESEKTTIASAPAFSSQPSGEDTIVSSNFPVPSPEEQTGPMPPEDSTAEEDSTFSREGETAYDSTFSAQTESEPASSQAAEAAKDDPFDSLFSGGSAPADTSEDNTMMMTRDQLNTLREESETSSEDSAPAGEKEWYVAIDDSQIGPIDVAEIEQRWDAREIDEDTLAWKAGMGDWTAIADIAELSYLVTEKPQSRESSLSAASATADGDVGASKPASALSPVAFGDGADDDDISWKPSAASALSSLVQEELVASEQKEESEEESASSENPAGIGGLPSFGAGANDLFGGGAGMPAPAGAPAAGFGGGGFPAAGGGFSVPRAPRSGGTHVAVMALLAVIGVSVVGAAGVFVYKQLGQPSGQPVPVAQAAVSADPPNGEKMVAEGGAAPERDPQQAHEDTKPASDPKPAVTKKKKKSSGSTSSSTSRRPAKKKKKDDLDDLLDDRPSKPKGPVKAKLTVPDIMAGVKKNAGKVMPCLKTASTRGEIAPGTLKLILDWDIKPNGSVTGARLKGPASVMGTSLPACFGRAMRKWKFPASKTGAPVKNFPFGPIAVR